MRALAIGLALAVAGCGKGQSGDLELTPDAGRYSSRGDVEKALEGVQNGMAFDVVLGQKQGFKYLPYEYQGSMVCNTVKGPLKFKGERAVLWVKGETLASVDAPDQDVEMRFSGTVNAAITVGTGLVWLEKLPNPKVQIHFKFIVKKPGTILVVNSATREELKQAKLKFTGKAVEVIAFECDLEPGRYKGSQEVWGGEELGGVYMITVFAKKEGTP